MQTRNQMEVHNPEQDSKQPQTIAGSTPHANLRRVRLDRMPGMIAPPFVRRTPKCTNATGLAHLRTKTPHSRRTNIVCEELLDTPNLTPMPSSYPVRVMATCSWRINAPLNMSPTLIHVAMQLRNPTQHVWYSSLKSMNAFLRCTQLEDCKH